MDHTADSAGVRISYSVEGPADAPVLLLSNSIGSRREMWARQVEALSATCRLIRYDTRGHGDSDVPAGDYSIDQLGRDALAVLDDAGAASAHVCGISLGGLTAMWLGVHAADRVSSLVLADTAARIGTLESWAERIALVQDQGMSGVADRAMLTWFTPDFRERDPDTVHTFRAMLQGCSPQGYLGCCAALRDADLREEIRAIRCPALVIAGAHDVATTPAQAEFVCSQIAGARLTTLDSAHLSNVEMAAEFTAAVLEFLDTTRRV
jgi:3-oxoadipate enol-lactonase